MRVGHRQLVVVADDYGIGPEVSRGILDLLRRGTVTSTVLLVNSPHVEPAIRCWNSAGRPGEMGWHPNLTMDSPTAPPHLVRSLLSSDGRLASLGTLMFRLATGRLVYADLWRELDAQLRRFYDLVGQPPTLVNGHKHIHIFPMIRRALAEVLNCWRIRPYVRRVMEPMGTWWRIPGARLKRAFLTTLGRLADRTFDKQGYPGNNVLAGVTDPKWVQDREFFARWLEHIPGRLVELMVHPGYRDETLIGRDCSPTDGQVERRVAEFQLLMDPTILEVIRKAGFRLVSAGQLTAGDAPWLRWVA